MAYQDDPPVAQRSQTSDDRLVVPVEPVALQLQEVGQRVSDVLQSLRPILMPRDLHGAPGRHRGVSVP